jgi:hypothetical protein
MSYTPPPESPPAPAWQYVLLGLAFVLAYLLWAVGFDWLARAMSGGGIEAALNWLSGVWFWGVIIVFGLVLAVSAMVKKD